MKTRQERIRNFSIIAHIDHGKSTLADRFLEITKAIERRRMREQVLDDMDLERERGITIKAHPVRLRYRSRADGQEYLFHLIDTPGHVDFRYEVSRAMAACEGAVLVVDASQGVQAQTLANIDLALEENLTLIPVLNKIDLPGTNLEVARRQLEDLGFSSEEILCCSAKEGTGVVEILEAVVERIPPPEGTIDAPLRALIFDSEYDSYLGAIAYIRIVDGSIARGDRIMTVSTGETHEVTEIGVFSPDRTPVERLEAGMVGYLTAALKKTEDVRVGDTITSARDPAPALEGYRKPLPMVFAGLYPLEGDRFGDLRSALEKLRLNDSAFTFEPETSAALGFGFRCGFLGLLHMEIIRERLEREFSIPLLATAPSVEFRVTLRNGETRLIDNPAAFPSAGEIELIEEPYIAAKIYTPDEYLGPILKLCQEKRGVSVNMSYPAPGRALLEYDLPLVEVVLDFFDRLKSVSRGFASLDYTFAGYRPGDLVRLDIRVNEESVDALSSIVHKDRAYSIGRELCARLKELIPRRQFAVPIQAAVGGRVIARETIRAMSKNVTAKCYGGDVTRKRKLLERQKEGKKKMKMIGRVEIPQSAFLAVLKRD
ncbi:MAG: elongation factor 4 [Candidatus Hydrogenedentota bacterium]|nr:MAG: elongation factor 4 [Candidatus Hydrogenedentota bacterium]